MIVFPGPAGSHNVFHNRRRYHWRRPCRPGNGIGFECSFNPMQNLRGFNFDLVAIKDQQGTATAGFFLGSRQTFGYDALRIYRNALLEELQTACKDRGIEILYNEKFSVIFAENEHGVQFGFKDGTKTHASLVIVADGIYSKIRQSLFPLVEPQYNGILVVAGAVKESSLAVSSDEDKISTPTMFAGKNGAFILGPQIPDGSELLAATQHAYPPHNCDEWGRLSQDRAFHVSFLREGYDDRQPVVQQAVDHIIDERALTFAHCIRYRLSQAGPPIPDVWC
ncbi:uncharacterized protein Z518_09479 [Rhinocladiella mackenziei CBS 650.93]|uniref:FAD-binding domain-containing protein n=1 Tax=Rhinocladiella mackenziei CBS 650.93 TaxID=1442369 RepID=A0A0D2FIA3_9EURO|nr:uncharacterized protein Z518_09479 [Rhinocladiella mackenziei CBS 650.93]KIX01752.1 hypothetical protein Z518_09479 [Rhinocladiella mackenziei CBS 650.93]